MAKKKAVEKTAKKEPQYNVQTMIGSLQEQIWKLFKENDKLNQRIDRIVDAISKSKSIKGL